MLKIVLSILLSVAIAICTANLVGSCTNRLSLYKNWKSSKADLEKPVSTTMAFVNTRPALAGEKMNLGAWNGYNEILYPASNVKEVNFRLFLFIDSYVAVTFNRDNNGYSGVLIGSDYLYENVFFRSKLSGEFSDKKPLSPFHLEPNRWYAIRMVSENEFINIYVNGTKYYSLPVDFSDGFVGFRGGERPIYIDNVKIFDQTGYCLANENFRSPFFLIVFFGALFLFFFVLFLSLKLNVPQSGIVLFQSAIFICLLMVNSVDAFLLSNRYPKYDDKLKAKEEAWVLDEEKKIKANLEVMASTQKLNTEIRILVLGSSQTWGSGVNKRGDEFTNLMQENWTQQNPTKNINVVNAGICGTNAKRLYDLYEKSFVNIQPDFVVINLSNNDNNFDERFFEEYLRKFCILNELKNIKTIFVLEPNSLEHRFYLPNHKIMQKVASDYAIQVIDAQSFMSHHHEDGFLWWDWVHMSSFGHKLMAKLLLEKIKI